MLSVTAVCENGVLKPNEPLNLTEGQTVQLSVDDHAHRIPPRQPTAEEVEFDRRIRAAESLDEMFAVMDAAPQSTDDFDVVKAINETRRLTGFRIPDPQEGAVP